MWFSSMERAGSGVREAGLSFLTVLWAADPAFPLCIRAEELNTGVRGDRSHRAYLEALEWVPQLFLCL